MSETYKHYKGGIYNKLGIVTHSETLEEMVLYQSAKDGRKWVRPVNMWDELVTVEGKQIPRFQKIQECEENK